MTVELEIYKNRVVGSNALPGAVTTDRTLDVAVGRSAYDLDVSSPHPKTASPPSDTTARTGDSGGSGDRCH